MPKKQDNVFCGGGLDFTQETFDDEETLSCISRHNWWVWRADHLCTLVIGIMQRDVHHIFGFQGRNLSPSLSECVCVHARV